MRKREASLYPNPGLGLSGAGYGALSLGVAVLLVLAPGRAQDAKVGSGSAGPTPTVNETTLTLRPATAPSNTPDYTVSPDDVLDVNVFEVPEISRPYRVSPSGFITLPLLREPVPAAGLSPSQLSTVIAGKFKEAGLLSNAQVTVSVMETRLHSVVIAGAVKKPQVYPVFGPIKLLQALSQVEGLADDAGNLAVINRGESGMRLAARVPGRAESGGEDAASSISVDVRKLLETGDERLNVLLYPGDRVIVQQAGIIYVIGAVGRPGGYPLKSSQEEMTVIKVLALAGDVTPSANRSKLIIFRRRGQSSAGREEVALDLRKIMKGRSPDQKLYRDDILIVPENGKLKAVRQAVGTGIGMGTAVTTGLIIYRR